MSNATEQLNQEIEYLDRMIEYLIKAEVAGSYTEEPFDLALELGETTEEKPAKEKTKESLKHYLSNLEASYIKR